MTSKVAFDSIGRVVLVHDQHQKSYAEASIGRIGYEARCAPYWAHSYTMVLLLGCFQECVLEAWRLSICWQSTAEESSLPEYLFVFLRISH
ncbi:hypothetical protein NC652_024992 [Populus alba x Populus x berolinensis]|nr:hypothetical protein NC652_024992 [Populus alba x Populus x berolinensis]